MIDVSPGCPGQLKILKKRGKNEPACKLIMPACKFPQQDKP
jgi:hypothetical protein